MSIPEAIEDLRTLFFQEERTYSMQTGFDPGYCPGFSNGNPHGLPCDCPKTRQKVLGPGRGQGLCYLGVCPVRALLGLLDYP